jgi:hypothetical protein
LASLRESSPGANSAEPMRRGEDSDRAVVAFI